MSEQSCQQPNMLIPEEIERYSRQLLLKGFGSREQLRLKHTSALVCSSPPSLALYLAALGVGILCIDGDGNEQSWLVNQIALLNPLIHLKSNENRVLEQNTLAEVQLPASAEGKALKISLRSENLNSNFNVGDRQASFILESDTGEVLKSILPESIVGAADLALGAYAALLISQYIISHPN